MSYNGGVAVAMKGKGCVAIACDKRYGVQNKTIATNFTKIFQYGDHCFVAFCGLATDVSVSKTFFSIISCFYLGSNGIRTFEISNKFI
jgi:20S proteasome subunit beta 3